MKKLLVYHSIAELLNLSEKEKMPLWQVIAQSDADQKDISLEEEYEQMKAMYLAMKEADEKYDKYLLSTSGLAGGDGEKIRVYNEEKRNLAGEYLGLVMEKAVKMGESNACMKKIVAAPTAGSCGVIPAVLLSFESYRGADIDELVKALFIAAGVGAVIAENASIAGASGGCQAEIGSSAAMAAAGLAFLQGGDNRSIANAAALALKNMLGLACDPVCGLVEVPCIKRNSAGAVNAVTSAQLALAGVVSKIPVDEVIDAMRRIGNDMPECLKETSMGGLATTETAQALSKNIS